MRSNWHKVRVRLGSLTPPQVGSTVADYRQYHAEDLASRGPFDDERMVTRFYDLVTDFYEFGWGDAFHFAPRYRGERLAASLARYQHYVALSMGLKAGMRLLDVGCGVGGPMRAIARFADVRIVGININAYQVRRANALNANARIEHKCSVVVADFMALALRDDCFDAAYAIEATCHAPDRARCFKEIYRVLKPGAYFCGYEWCLTERFDRHDRRHLHIKKEIEQGNGLPELTSTDAVLNALRTASFEIISCDDRAPSSDAELPGIFRWHDVDFA